MLNADIAEPEREALALVWACERFHLYVYGPPKFDLVTDHEALPGLSVGFCAFIPTIIKFAMCPRERILQMPCRD